MQRLTDAPSNVGEQNGTCIVIALEKQETLFFSRPPLESSVAPVSC